MTECEECGKKATVKTWSMGDEIYIEVCCVYCNLTAAYGL